MMTLEILICTMEQNLGSIAQMLLPRQDGISYLVSCQYLSAVPSTPIELSSRSDVRVMYLQGKGLSHNRNNALRHAVNDILLLADDDGSFYPDGISQIRNIYEQNPSMDIALFMVDGMSKFYPDNNLHFKQDDFKGSYCVASVEMSFRRSSIRSFSFNEHFGLGSEYLSAGEEQVFLFDALRQGLNVWWFPVLIGKTSPGTTGERFLSDERVQRSKGATFCYLFGCRRARWMCMKEAMHYLVYKRVNPLKLMQRMNDGIRYIERLGLCRK